MVLIIVTAIFIGSIGVFFSTLYKRTTPATVSSYGAILFLVVGTFVILWAAKVVAELGVSNQVIVDNVYYNTDIGNWVLWLLINPAMTCYSMLQGQIGTGYELGRFINEYGRVSDFIVNNWFVISIVVQLAVSMVMVLLSAWMLNPLRKKRGKSAV